jgi:hypothetical protein
MPLSTLWAAYVALSTLGLLVHTSASEQVEFSGKYVGERDKHAPSNQNAPTLEVAQNQDSIEITRVELGKKTFSRCPLNGSEGEYISPGGMPGKCKAQLKGKYLILDSVVPIPSKPWRESAPPLTVHTRERWQLSSAETLTIKSDVNFPNFPVDISATVAPMSSKTTKYKRTTPQ